ncbi:hypothetical protein FB451DRAFT_1205473 [Mycena latifolia]|nr:hypothetical protein FB451DRAFT_1205473 [Mycena latifolia]
MSTKKETFPLRRPIDQPPPVCGELVNGRRTPTYVLAWVCPPRKFFENLGGGTLGKVDDSNYRLEVSKKWAAWPEFPSGLAPTPMYEGDGNYYLVAMFNTRNCDHLRRIRDMATDQLIQSARVSMGVDQDPALEETLQWFRFPLNWLQAEANQREVERLKKLESELDDKSASDSAPTSPPMVSVH